MTGLTEPELLGHVRRILSGMVRARGEQAPRIDESTVLLGGRDLTIDSLDLATLVVELEQITERDPFRTGFKDFRTVGELLRLYRP
jgi:acyl carrier protein